MEFQSNGQPLTEVGLERVSNSLGVGEAEVWAVLAVETLGFGFLRDRRPQILFERHIFHKLTGGQFDAGNEDISSSAPGGYDGGAAEYKRLEKAMALDREASLKSTSWGIGQVMGFNFDVVGFTNVEDMVASMVKDEDSQLLAVGNFIKSKGLTAALRIKDWTTFARVYNGPDFQKNEYDTRLAAAFAKFEISLPNMSLRTAQVALDFLGIDPGPIDGLRGRRTRSALIRFQQLNDMEQTGELDSETQTKLFARAFSG
jgi:N-acetylmuramidase-like protein/putative peptidoglycan binding protein